MTLFTLYSVGLNNPPAPPGTATPPTSNRYATLLAPPTADQSPANRIINPRVLAITLVLCFRLARQPHYHSVSDHMPTQPVFMHVHLDLAVPKLLRLRYACKPFLTYASS
ncbi:hypothetical protein IF2G_00624 [Cordyceps javanica]|nr:hypothetical protein IF2G_00624 [Cordyceps javanica]